eukprot:augustus_masked-scaffold_29-processed-gene-1.16-mRNA-1 protein AED:0.02 eAED:0.02 QI:0/-1/0/1/-1/1/1/0/709
MTTDDDESVKNLSKSVITDPFQYYKALSVATFLLFCAAGAYIVMVFIAFPLSIHSIVNENNGCDLEVDSACFAPTSESQTVYTVALMLLRSMTFLFGSFWGVVSDKYGRRPVMLFALSGYAASALFFIMGWNLRRPGLMILGAGILGSASPVGAHGVAYATDISKPEVLARGLGFLQGFGFFCGLMFGAAMSLGISSLTTARSEDFDAFNKLFNYSFLAGFSLAGLGTLVGFFFLPESLHISDRTDEISLKRANPLGFVGLITRTKYFFCLWIAIVFAWIGIGSQEAILGGWWLRRYAITEPQVFIAYSLAVWIAAGFGAIIMTHVYVSVAGVKTAFHIGAVATILLGVVTSVAYNVKVAYAAVPVSFFAAPSSPILISIIMGQVDSKENGALAGALRSSEAFAKLVGITILGNAFANYIAPFRPDDSCLDTVDEFGNNDCLCGIDSCGYYNGEDTDFPFDQKPSTCTLGQMSFLIVGSPSKGNPVPEDDNLNPIPQVFFEEREGTCITQGMVPSSEGQVRAVSRQWCRGVDDFLNTFIGCPGYDFVAFEQALAFQACSEEADEELFNTTRFDLDPLDLGTANKECSDRNEAVFENLDESNFESLYDEEQFETFGPIHGRVLDPDFESIAPDYCTDEFDTFDLNFCFAGTVTDTPWLMPLLATAFMAGMSYLTFVIAEMFFISGDQKYWSAQKFQDTEIKKSEIISPSI